MLGHGGGNDLMFPHHENEIAQSRCMGHKFAKIWMHNEMLQVDGRKMSKSLGNIFTVRDLLDRDIPGEVIRFVILSTHYRKPMDWTDEKAREAQKRLAKWYRKTEGVTASDTAPASVVAALSDDLNTHLALTEMDRLGAKPLKAAMRLLGFPEAEDVSWNWKHEATEVDGVQFVGSGDEAHAALARTIALKWQQLRAEKLFGEADALKAQALAAGLELRALKDTVQAEELGHLDAAKLEALT